MVKSSMKKPASMKEPASMKKPSSNSALHERSLQGRHQQLSISAEPDARVVVTDLPHGVPIHCDKRLANSV
eukprot:2360969-Karenia_brevis.AAC.1